MNSTAAPCPLQVGEQIDDLSLNRYVEGAHRLIAHQQLSGSASWPAQCRSAGMAPAELVRVPAQDVPGKAHALEHPAHPRFPLTAPSAAARGSAAAPQAHRRSTCVDSGLPADPETRFAGRAARGAALQTRASADLLPRELDASEAIGIRRSTARAIVDLPDRIADQTHDLPGPYGEGHVLEHGNRAESHVQPLTRGARRSCRERKMACDLMVLRTVP